MPFTDSDAGYGVGTPAGVITGTHPNIPETYFTLEDYWDFLQINENAGRGIRNYPTSGVLGLGCGDYWDQSSRFYLASSIKKAEQRLESDRWLGFPIRWKFYKVQRPYSVPISLGKYVRNIGVETDELIDSDVFVPLSSGGTINDPVELTATVDFTSIHELVVYYPGTSKRIIPSDIAISGTTATIKIPRARLLKPEYYKNYVNDNERPDYTDDSYFLTSVDLYRKYVDTTTGVNIVWWRHKGQIYCHNDVLSFPCEGSVSVCNDVRQLACAYIQNQRTGEVTVEPATYSSGWSRSKYAVRREPDGLELNYMRGRYQRYEKIDEELARAIIAIAHNNMPRRYCSCDQQTLYYEDDTRPLEPPVRLGLGRSTWGLYEAEQIIREFDSKQYGGFAGGLL